MCKLLSTSGCSIRSLQMLFSMLLLITPSFCKSYGVPALKAEIKSLPGVSKEEFRSYPRMFTGYLDAGVPPSGVGTMYFHYWLVESQGNPAKDPVIFWYNGGPGASSLWGLLEEIGPFKLNVESYDSRYRRTGIPTPKRNKYSWNLHATIVAIDSPPPIGLSFCTSEGPGGNATSCGPWSDLEVFKANRNAYQQFFNFAFPEFKYNGLVVAGESYAGIYVPGIINTLLDSPIRDLKLIGFAIGDGCTSCEVIPGQKVNWCFDLDNVGVFKYPNVNPGPWYDVEFFHGHSQFSEDLYRKIRYYCPESELRSPNLTAKCLELVDEMAEEIGGFFPYNLENNCESLFETSDTTTKIDKYGMNSALRRKSKFLRALGLKHDRQAGAGAPCSGNAVADWILSNQTLQSINTPLDIRFINLDNAHGFTYIFNQPDVRPIYQKAIAKGMRILIYEGDTDACGLQTAPIEDKFVPYFSRIGLEQTRKWRPFTLNGKRLMGGYVIEWEHRKAQFVSIRGAGHLSPINAPETSQLIIKSFLKNQSLPEYHKMKENIFARKYRD